MEGIQTIQALKAVQSSLPAQTTIPSDELVMLYAADGTPIAKIARDDLVKAVASVMASNSQTTFSKLLGVQANGTPMGIGASDLASVLGVPLNSNKLKIFTGVEGNSAIDAVQSFYNNLPDQSIFLAHLLLTTQHLCIGYKANNNYGAMIGISYSNESSASVYTINIYGGTWSKNDL